jgi:glycosyltransferase involved in cell wall biosynthesis
VARKDKPKEAEGGRTRVLLLRDVPEERRYSMERYANELELALQDHSGFLTRSTAVHESRIARRLRIPRADSYFARFVKYPLAAGRARGAADIFHVIDHGYAHVTALLPKDRTVVTCHDLILLKSEDGTTGVRGTPTSVFRFRWSTSYLRRVAHVICVSRSTRSDVVRYWSVDETRMSVIPPGIDVQFRSLDDERVRRLRQAPELGQHPILHVSTGVPYKNVSMTLRVLAALRESGVDATLVRVGAPLNSTEISLATQLRVHAHVVECGHVDDERLVELYNACEVLLFPSFYEGFGWPVLEAMACGTPVVTSDAPALAELVGDAGLVASPQNLRGLADAVRAILDDPEVASNLRARGLARASQFTWRRAAAGVADVYAKVLEESGRRAGRELRT